MAVGAFWHACVVAALLVGVAAGGGRTSCCVLGAFGYAGVVEAVLLGLATSVSAHLVGGAEWRCLVDAFSVDAFLGSFVAANTWSAVRLGGGAAGWFWNAGLIDAFLAAWIAAVLTAYGFGVGTRCAWGGRSRVVGFPIPAAGEGKKYAGNQNVTGFSNHHATPFLSRKCERENLPGRNTPPTNQQTHGHAHRRADEL